MMNHLGIQSLHHIPCLTISESKSNALSLATRQVETRVHLQEKQGFSFIDLFFAWNTY